MSGQVFHHAATGVHPAAYINPTAPLLPDDAQDGVLWIDNSAGPPYVVRRWNESTAAWEPVQMDSTGYPLPHLHRLEEYVTNQTPNPPDPPVLGTTHAFSNPFPAGTYTLGYTYETSGGETALSPTATITVDGTQWITLTTGPAPFGLGPHFVFGISVYVVEPLPLGVVGVYTGYVSDYPVDTTVNVSNDTAPGASQPPSQNQTGTWQVRVVDPNATALLDLPLPVLSSAPATLVGRDPSTGLPAFCPQPAIPPDVLTLAPPVPVPTGGATTCAQVRCGAADALANKLADTYHTVEQWVQPALTGLLASFFSALAGAGFTLLDLMSDGLGLTLTEGEIALVASIDRAIGALTAGVLGDALPFLNSDQQAWLKQAAFDSLVCTNDTVQLDGAQMDAWYQRILNASGDPPNFGFIQQEALYAIVGWGRDLALADWATAANTGAHSPSTACDSWS